MDLGTNETTIFPQTIVQNPVIFYVPTLIRQRILTILSKDILNDKDELRCLV